LNLLLKTEQNKMSIQIIQVLKKQGEIITKKGRKLSIMDFVDVKQFWFQEEVWEHIKEFIITPRSMLLLKMKKLGHNRLCKIFWNYFQRDYQEGNHTYLINDRHTPLEQRKNFIKSRIIKGCETPTKYAEIMEKEFQVKPKNYDWLKDFAVGEEVIVRQFNSKLDIVYWWTKTKNRKGVIRKIGKTIQVELYDYEFLRGVPRDEYRLLETFEEKVSVYRRNNLYKRGECCDKLFN